MSVIYIDSEFKCHVSPGSDYTALELEDFNGKCDQYIEGFRFVPAGNEWVRDDGATFRGPMLSPFIDTRLLEAFQFQYESFMKEMDDAWQEGVNSI